MKLRCIYMVMVGLLAMACAKSPAIKSGTEHLPDLSPYRTYQWLQNSPQAHIDAVADDEIDRIIHDAIVYQLDRKGLQQSTANPDLLITYRTTLRRTFTEMPFSRGNSDVQEAAQWAAMDQKSEGAISIDLIDPLTQKRFWRGTATARVRDAQDAREKVPEAVRILLAD